jgi:uroporphyrinogen-III synthase
MNERVAITRAAPENAHTAARLQKRGAIPLLSPLLDIEHVSFDADLRQVQALLFTSSNGVHAFARQSHARAAPVLAVGDATAAAARSLGFADVRSADGDVAALALLAKSTLDPRAGKLVHVAGARVAGDLAGALAAAGFEIERRTGYEAKAVTRLPVDFADPLDIVLFHSARAAQIFVDLGAPKSETMTAACLSAAVALAAQKTVWARVTVAPAPREDALLVAALGR